EGWPRSRRDRRAHRRRRPSRRLQASRPRARGRGAFRARGRAARPARRGRGSRRDARRRPAPARSRARHRSYGPPRARSPSRERPAFVRTRKCSFSFDNGAYGSAVPRESDLGAVAGAFGGATSSTGGVRAGVAVVNTSLAGAGAAAGTGIALSSSGEVVTNNHVIRGATSIRVTVPSTGRTYAATVAGYSMSEDIALLMLRNAHGLTTASVGNSNFIKVGDQVTAVGNAGGAGVLSTKTGKLVGLQRAITVSD